MKREVLFNLNIMNLFVSSKLMLNIFTPTSQIIHIFTDMRLMSFDIKSFGIIDTSYLRKSVFRLCPKSFTSNVCATYYLLSILSNLIPLSNWVYCFILKYIEVSIIPIDFICFFFSFPHRSQQWTCKNRRPTSGPTSKRPTRRF